MQPFSSSASPTHEQNSEMLTLIAQTKQGLQGEKRENPTKNKTQHIFAVLFQERQAQVIQLPVALCTLQACLTLRGLVVVETKSHRLIHVQPPEPSPILSVSLPPAPPKKKEKRKKRGGRVIFISQKNVKAKRNSFLTTAAHCQEQWTASVSLKCL